MKTKTFWLIVILVVVLLVIALLKPAWIQQSWMWIAGLAGSIGVFFKRISNFIEKGSPLKQVETENEDIKKRLDGLKAEIADTETRLQRERELHKREIALLQSQLAIKEKEIVDDKDHINTISNLSPLEYFRSLSPAEQQKIISEANLNVVPYPFVVNP